MMGDWQPERLYRLLASHIPNAAIFFFDRDLRYVLADGPELLQRGFASEHFLGKTLHEAVPPDIADQYEPIIRATLVGSTTQGEVEFLGEQYWTQTVPVRDEAGAIIGCLLLSMNVTARKNAQTAEIEIERLRAALDKEHELHAVRNKMLLRIAHEFRNPLAVILTSAYLLQQYARRMSLSEQLEHFARIEERVKHLGNLLDDLSTAIQPGAQHFQPHTFDLHALTREISTNPRVNYTFAGDLTTVYSDPRHVRTILMHLLNNALKFSAPDAPVTLHLEAGGDQITIIVRDAGIGILPTEHPHIFEPFFRGSNFTELPGLGIGLTQVQTAVHLCGGDIHVTSQPNAGSTITITLPSLSQSA